MMSLTFGLFTQVSGSGPSGRLVLSSVLKLTMQLSSCCNAFWGNIHPFTMPGPPGELMTREKYNF